jgi:hypothetical protein
VQPWLLFLLLVVLLLPSSMWVLVRLINILTVLMLARVHTPVVLACHLSMFLHRRVRSQRVKVAKCITWHVVAPEHACSLKVPPYKQAHCEAEMVSTCAWPVHMMLVVYVAASV